MVYVPRHRPRLQLLRLQRHALIVTQFGRAPIVIAPEWVGDIARLVDGHREDFPVKLDANVFPKPNKKIDQHVRQLLDEGYDVELG